MMAAKGANMRVSDEVRHCAPRSAQLAYKVGAALVAPLICAARVGLRDGPLPLWECAVGMRRRLARRSATSV